MPENNDSRDIFVTKPSLAPLEEYRAVLNRAWTSGVLTHNGPLVRELEKKLMALLNIRGLVAVTNGTVALQLAIRSLGLKGDIITTPFTWIATLSAIQWEGCTPVFVDVDPGTFNMDPSNIEAAITSRTCAILPVHVFGNPCDIGTIDGIGKKHRLKVIYDAAHAMCVSRKNQSVLSGGDISATSFHATKIFNTGEGGACVTADDDLCRRLQQLRFFGHDENKEIVTQGLNGKMTEVHAALGIVNLQYIPAVLKKRRSIYERYRQRLGEYEYIRFQQFDPDSYNYSYMPVVFDTEERLLKTVARLNARRIFPRRYFHPSLNTVKSIAPYSPMPNSEDLASRILCLPSFHDLELETVDMISRLIVKIH